LQWFASGMKSLVMAGELLKSVYKDTPFNKSFAILLTIRANIIKVLQGWIRLDIKFELALVFELASVFEFLILLNKVEYQG
jgi:hypothetical protein